MSDAGRISVITKDAIMEIVASLGPNRYISQIIVVSMHEIINLGCINIMNPEIKE